MMPGIGEHGSVRDAQGMQSVISLLLLEQAAGLSMLWYGLMMFAAYTAYFCRRAHFPHHILCAAHRGAVRRRALPQQSDTDLRRYRPRHPVPVPSSYPRTPHEVVDNPALFRKASTLARNPFCCCVAVSALHSTTLHRAPAIAGLFHIHMPLVGNIPTTGNDSVDGLLFHINSKACCPARW
jgi:hypothetical protein